MTKWQLTYDGETYDLDEDEARRLRSVWPVANAPARWVDVVLRDERRLSVLMSVGVGLSVVQKASGKIR